MSCGFASRLWSARPRGEQLHVIYEDIGLSGSGAVERSGSRLARNNAHPYRLLDLRGMAIPWALFNDRLLLGL